MNEPSWDLEVFPHQNGKLVNNWKNQRSLNSVISYKLNLFDKHSQDKS